MSQNLISNLSQSNTLLGMSIGAASVLAVLGGMQFLKKEATGCTGKTKESEVEKGCKEPAVPSDEKDVLVVAVTGAAGQIGYAFLPLLLNGLCFGANTKIDLRLLDVPQAESILRGVEMEVLDGAYPLLHSVQYGSNPKTMFKDADVVVFIGGFPRKPGMERKDLLEINGKIFIEQGQALNEFAKKTCKCLVVANPANTNCLILANSAPSIPKENFTALTRLDQNRGLSQIAQKAHSTITQVSDVIIWGNHSATQYPDIEHAKITVDGVEKSVREAVNDDEYLENQYIKKVQLRGAEVLEARKNSSVASAANAVKDHLHDWYFGSGSRIVSMGVYTQVDGPYGVPEGLVFSLPLITSKFGYKIVEGLSIDPKAQERIRITTDELISERGDFEAVLEAEKVKKQNQSNE